jgi:hypothetical protein
MPAEVWALASLSVFLAVGSVPAVGSVVVGIVVGIAGAAAVAVAGQRLRCCLWWQRPRCDLRALCPTQKHPDKRGNTKESQVEFVAIVRAYEILKGAAVRVASVRHRLASSLSELLCCLSRCARVCACVCL